jgi:hypothetical protein
MNKMYVIQDKTNDLYYSSYTVYGQPIDKQYVFTAEVILVDLNSLYVKHFNDQESAIKDLEYIKKFGMPQCCDEEMLKINY